MIRPFTCLAFLLACGSGLYLYQSKHRVKVLDEQIEQTVQDPPTRCASRRRMLSAEWTLLNDPERLRQLASQFLTLQTVSPNQFTSLADLDSRLPPPVPPGSLPTRRRRRPDCRSPRTRRPVPARTRASRRTPNSPRSPTRGIACGGEGRSPGQLHRPPPHRVLRPPCRRTSRIRSMEARAAEHKPPVTHVPRRRRASCRPTPCRRPARGRYPRRTSAVPISVRRISVGRTNTRPTHGRPTHGRPRRVPMSNASPRPGRCRAARLPAPMPISADAIWRLVAGHGARDGARRRCRCPCRGRCR